MAVHYIVYSVYLCHTYKNTVKMLFILIIIYNMTQSCQLRHEN